MSETAILSAARAAVAAALPAAIDWSDDPADVRVDKLDAFVVTLVRDSSEIISMGSSLEDVQLTLEVESFGTYAAAQDGQTLIGDKALAARAAIRSDPAFAALCYLIQGGAFDVEIAAGESRMARATATLTLSAEF
jgi:hypothetical protein